MIPRLVPEISPLDAFCDVGVVGVGIGDSRSWIHFWWIGFWKIYFWQIHYTSVHLPPELKSTLQRSPHRVRDLWETAYSSSFQEKCHSTPLHSSTVRCLTVKLFSAFLNWSVPPSNAELGIGLGYQRLRHSAPYPFPPKYPEILDWVNLIVLKAPSGKTEFLVVYRFWESKLGFITFFTSLLSIFIAQSCQAKQCPEMQFTPSS